MLFKNTKNFVFTLISLLSMVANADVMWPSPNSQPGQQTSYPPVAVAVCNKLPSHESVGDCLLANKGNYFDPKVQDFCISKIQQFERKDCLAATKNKTYQQVELEACAQEQSYYRNDCLKKMGQTYNPMRPSETVSSDPVLDALDSLLRDLLRESYQTTQQVDYCRVENSNGTFLGNVDATQFIPAAQKFARDNDSCVVTNVKNVQRTRALIGTRGTILETRLTEKETSQMKKRYGFSRCRILTCDLQEATVVTTPSYDMNGILTFQ